MRPENDLRGMENFPKLVFVYSEAWAWPPISNPVQSPKCQKEKPSCLALTVGILDPRDVEAVHDVAGVGGVAQLFHIVVPGGVTVGVDRE